MIPNNKILIDSRCGSKELQPFFPFQSTELIQLDFADFAFSGHGPNESIVKIGIERKTISDFANSIVTNRLFGHQIPGLLLNYNRSIVIIEGSWRHVEEKGKIEYLNSRGYFTPLEASVPPARFFSTIFTMTEKYGINVIHCSTSSHTVETIKQLFNWWNKEYDNHSTGINFYTPVIDTPSLLPPNLVVKIAAQLPGVGPKLARQVAKHFKSPLDLAISTVDQWRNIEGIGEKKAKQIVDALRKEC